MKRNSLRTLTLLLLLAAGALGLRAMRMQTHPSPNTPSTSPMKEIYLAGVASGAPSTSSSKYVASSPQRSATPMAIPPVPAMRKCVATRRALPKQYTSPNAPDQVSLSKLLELYFLTIDPTSLNKQGGDVGDQYRTGIYYTDTRRPYRRSRRRSRRYSVSTHSPSSSR